jgi:hypothetical protein
MDALYIESGLMSFIPGNGITAVAQNPWLDVLFIFAYSLLVALAIGMVSAWKERSSLPWALAGFILPTFAGILGVLVIAGIVAVVRHRHAGLRRSYEDAVVQRIGFFDRSWYFRGSTYWMRRAGIVIGIVIDICVFVFVDLSIIAVITRGAPESARLPATFLGLAAIFLPSFMLGWRGLSEWERAVEAGNAEERWGRNRPAARGLRSASSSLSRTIISAYRVPAIVAPLFVVGGVLLFGASVAGLVKSLAPVVANEKRARTAFLQRVASAGLPPVPPELRQPQWVREALTKPSAHEEHRPDVQASPS